MTTNLAPHNISLLARSRVGQKLGVDGQVLCSEYRKAEIKVLAGPSFYLEALKEKSTSKFILIVGRIQLFSL